MRDKDSKGEPELAFNQPEIEALVVSPDGRFVATSEQFERVHYRASSTKPTPSPAIRIWEAATGKEIQTLEGYRAACISLAFSPDGRRLASAFHNDTVLVWDISRTVRPEVRRQKLTLDQMEKLWMDLALADGGKAYNAICTMQDGPEEAIEYLKRHLRPVPMSDSKNVQRLIQSLGSNQFVDREASAKELVRLTAQFRMTIRMAVKTAASLEVKRRLESILAEAPRQLPPESLRTLRSIQTLERIGSTEASRLLSKLADGTPEAYETIAAQTALHRLTMRSKSSVIGN